ncbi:NUDIX hydrolase [Ostreibacterium oceani]|uniref:DUF4743 domain-containing protein n=1 Tax=Ostreibacterium oceani TaxID=2654998 RepID=A0A6N7EU29_9GAMM|nr:DUF4743 domain-containing protein [Ostreibacterium oceani]MPV85473.1 DUF4743 domain-containing protein [Ostreibacterium oceani]
MALIDRLYEVNRRIPKRQYYPLFVNGTKVGQVDVQLLDALKPPLFCIDNAFKTVNMSFASESCHQFEDELADFFVDFFAHRGLSGWRDERYAVKACHGSPTLFLLERAALSYLGITGYGVHVNGYVKKSDGIHMWVAKRASNKPTSPGKYDQIAAGGQPHDLSVWENMIKECQEEASIPEWLAKTAVPASAISYRYDLPIGLRPDVIFNYDLCLPADFVPTVNDDEVESFMCVPIHDLLDWVAGTQDFKFNSAVVIIDFAIRHGLIGPEHSDYLRLQQGMYQPL